MSEPEGGSEVLDTDRLVGKGDRRDDGRDGGGEDPGEEFEDTSNSAAAADAQQTVEAFAESETTEVHSLDSHTDIDDLEPGDRVEIERMFGGEEEVEVIDHVPDGVLVETEDGGQITATNREINPTTQSTGSENGDTEEDTGESSEGIIDQMVSDFESLGDASDSSDSDSLSERRTLSEAEEAELQREKAQQKINEFGLTEHTRPDPESDPQGVSIDTTDIHESDRSKLTIEDRETLQSTLESPEFWQTPVSIHASGDDVEYGPWDNNTSIGQYDGKPDWKAGYVDVEMDTDDFLTLQEKMLRRSGESAEKNQSSFYAGVEPCVTDYTETFQNEPGEIPMPFIEVGKEGNLIRYQEGRHRALAAKKAGYDTMPVRVVIRRDRTGMSDEEFANLGPSD